MSERLANPLTAATDLRGEIEAREAEIDRERRLPADLVETLRSAGLFHLLLHKSLGGSETDPVTAARVVEEVALADGSAGWCLMIAAQAAAYAGYTPQEPAAEILGRGPDRGGRGAADRAGAAGGVAGSGLRGVGPLAVREREQPRRLAGGRVRGARRGRAAQRRGGEPGGGNIVRAAGAGGAARHVGPAGPARDGEQRLQHGGSVCAGAAACADHAGAAAPLGRSVRSR